MYQQILDTLLTQYGHLPYSELTEALRNDGLGQFVDALEQNETLMSMMADMSEEFARNLPDNLEHGILPSSLEQIPGVPVALHDTFAFDHLACLKTCKGECCKNKNYLMINITDIFRILTSKAAPFFHLRSTIDLFERQPPLIVLLYRES